MPFEDVSIGQFDGVDLDVLLVDTDEQVYTQYHLKLTREGENASAGGDTDRASACHFTSALCSMMLKPASPTEPFEPMMVMQGRRTMIPADLTENQRLVVRALLDKTTDPELLARLSDLLWTLERDYKAATLAIDSYVASGNRLFGPATWLEPGDRFERAARLATLLGDEGRLTEVLRNVARAIEEARKQELTWLPERLMGILLEFRGREDEDYTALSETLANDAEARGSWREARHYWRMASRWHAVFKRDEESALDDKRAAETYVNEANHADSGIVRMVLLGKARDTLAKVRGTRERQAEVNSLALEAQRAASDEMKTVSVEIPAPDEWRAHLLESREAVKGKSLEDALAAVASLLKIQSIAQLRAEAEETMTNFPMRFLVTSYTLGDDDKVVAKSDSTSDPDKEREGQLRAEMYSQASLYRGLSVQGTLRPALEQLAQEHQVRLGDIEIFVEDRAFVPVGREEAFAKGIYAGLKGDFSTAAHLLIPQLENALRHVLEQSGVLTFGVGQDRLQYEFDLNRLLYMKETAELLGEDLVFELRGLLVEQCSSNLRNRLSHGMMDDRDLMGLGLTAVWWVSLALIVLVYGSR